MEATIVYWAYMGIVNKKMETTIGVFCSFVTSSGHWPAVKAHQRASATVTEIPEELRLAHGGF